MIWQSLTNSNGFAALSFCQPVTTNAAKCKVTTTLVTKASTSTQHQQNLKNVGIKFQQYLYLNQVYLICHLILKPTKTPVPDTHPHQSHSPTYDAARIPGLQMMDWRHKSTGQSALQDYWRHRIANRDRKWARGDRRNEVRVTSCARAGRIPSNGDHAKTRPEIWAARRGRR